MREWTDLKADAVIYATGYWRLDRLGGQAYAEGDQGPWIGELRNMWKPTAQQGLWFMGGNLSQARYFSRLLALQLAKRHRG